MEDLDCVSARKCEAVLKGQAFLTVLESLTSLRVEARTSFVFLMGQSLGFSSQCHGWIEYGHLLILGKTCAKH